MPGIERLLKYSFINAKLRGKISNLLDEDFFLEMIKASTVSEAAGILNDTPYREAGGIYERTGDIKLAEADLYKKEILVFMELEKYLRDEVLDFVRALAARYEIENLKSYLRLWFDRVIKKRRIENSSSYIYRGVIRHNLYPDRIINAESAEEISVILSSSPYGRIISENSGDIETYKNIFKLETALDIYFYQKLYEKAGKLNKMDYKITLRMTGAEIDTENITRLARFRDFYKMPADKAFEWIIPFGSLIDRKILKEAYKSRDYFDVIKSRYRHLLPDMMKKHEEHHEGVPEVIQLEKILDRIILKEVGKIMGGDPFSIGIILSYFVLKKNEMRKVMTVLNAKYYGIEESRIKSAVL